jgi:Secretion system C-terminal sorting domain
MKKIIRRLLVSFLFVCFCSWAFQEAAAQVSGVKTIPGDYASITQAVQQLRTVGISGPTFLELQAGYNSAVETFPIKIREIPGTSSVNKITISPAAGATGLSIIADNSEAMIEFIGAYNIIIDGRAGRTGSTRELTIRNNSTAGKVISFYDGAVDNAASYCIVEAAAIPAIDPTSLVYFGRSTEPIPDGVLLENTGNTISNCIIMGNNTGATVQFAIYAVRTSSVQNAGNKIIGNEILNFLRGIDIGQDGGSNWTINGNSFYNPNQNNGSTVINFQPGPGSVNNTITGNFIGGQATQAGGGPWVDDSHTADITGIIIAAGSIVVENNVMQNFSLQGSGRPASFIGIDLKEGAAQIRGNLFGGTNGANGTVLEAGYGTSFSGIRSLSCFPVLVENNRMSNITMRSPDPLFSSYFKGILFRAGSGTVVTGNQVDQVMASGPGTFDFAAISVFPTTYPETAECAASPQPTVIDHNLINNITLSSDGDSATFRGIEIFGTSGPATQLHNNEVYKINVSAPEGIASFTGIHVNDRIAANTGNIIGSATEANSIMVTGESANAIAILVNRSPDASVSDDIIGNIKVYGALSASMEGIRFMGGGVSKVSGNQLSDLAVSSIGSSTMAGISFNGAVTSIEPSTLHNNKVYKINVSSTEGTASFSGININDRISANTGNIIGSLADANSIVVTGRSAFANGIRLKNSPDVSVSDDIIANITATGTLIPASVNGIVFEAGTLAKISGNNIHHLSAPLSRGIFLQPSHGSSKVNLEKNTLTGTTTSAGTGMETFVGSEASLDLIVTDNTVSNWQTGILLAAASGATLQQSFQSNAVISNQTGFINQNGTPVNATCNWWGDASGPSGAGPGTGNPVGPNVVFSPWATIQNYVAVNAGADHTIYLGYGSSVKSLNAVVTVCGTPTFLWSTGATTATISVSPLATTTYSVTVSDANNHVATDELTIYVKDIRCGNGLVAICHKESKSRKKSKCIPSGDVAAHLAHGDSLGQCADGTAARNYATTSAGLKNELIEAADSEPLLMVYPNPAINQLQLRWKAAKQAVARITIVDGLGRMVYEHTVIQKEGNNYQQVSFPKLKNGNYLLLIRSGTETKTTKIFILR